MDGLTVVVALLILVGLVGIVVPVLPGLFLVWVAVLIWALAVGTSVGWVVLGIATVLAFSGALLQYLLPRSRLRTAGVTATATMAGAALAVVGFFVIPVVGMFLGFALGVYLAERARMGDHAMAWSSTMHALKAIGLSIGIELVTGLTIAATWVGGVLSA